MELQPDELGLVMWEKKDYMEGTVGHKVFPPQLDQRLRLADPLYLEAGAFLLGIKKHDALGEHRLETVQDLLLCDLGELSRLWRGKLDYIRSLQRLNSLLVKLAWSPDDRLMARIFRREEIGEVQVLPGVEEPRGLVLKALVSTLPDRHRRVLDRTLGLTDWHPLSFRLAAREFGRPEAGIRNDQAEAIGTLRQLDRANILRTFLPPLE